MAYLGRENITSIGNRLENNNDNEELNVSDKKLHERMRYGYGLLQVYLYLPLSNTYVIFSIIGPVDCFGVNSILPYVKTFLYPSFIHYFLVQIKNQRGKNFTQTIENLN